MFYSVTIPDSAVVTTTGVGLIGPGCTVNASTVQLYTVNGVSPLTVPVVVVKSA